MGICFLDTPKTTFELHFVSRPPRGRRRPYPHLLTPLLLGSRRRVLIRGSQCYHNVIWSKVQQ